MGVSDLQRAAWNHLMKTNKSVVDGLIDDGLLGVDKDANGLPDTTKPYSNGWVFRADRDGAPFRSVEGSSRGAICFMVYDSWASSTMWHSSTFPNLHIAIFGDPTRDNDKAFPTRLDGKDRALKIYERLHPLFHDNSNSIHKFDTLSVVSSVAGGGFSLFPYADGDGAVRLDQVYNIHL